MHADPQSPEPTVPGGGPFRERLVLALLLGLAFLYLALNAGLYVWYAWSIAHYPFAIDYGEGHVLQRVIGLLAGQSPYPPFGEAPFLIGNYPPVFDLLVAIPTYFAGPQLLWGRATSILATLATGMLIGVWVQRETGRATAAWLAGLLFFASHWLAIWSVVSRIDLVAVAFSMAGLLAFSQEHWRQRKPMLMLSAGLFSAAIYTRHSAVAAPLACLIFLGANLAPWSRAGESVAAASHFRALKQFAIYLLIAVGVPALGLQWLTDGHFLPHISTLTVGLLRQDNLLNLWSSFSTVHAVALLLAVAYVALSVWQRRLSLALMFWLLAMAGTLSAANTGSYVNYFQEAWAATCVLCGLLLAEGPEVSGQKRRNNTLAVLLVLALLFQLSIFRKYAALMVPGEPYATAGNALVQWIRQTPGDVLSEDTAFMAMAGKRTVYQPFSMSKLVRTGRWNPAPIVDMIARQHFSLVLMQDNAASSERWTPDVVAAVERHYELRAIVPVFEVSVIRDHAKQLRVYVPKTTAQRPTSPGPAGATGDSPHGSR